MKLETVTFETHERLARVTFNRPEIHNAFNATVIYEMTEVFRRIAADDAVRAVVLSGRGKSFCAGADLNWMRGVIRQTFEQNLAEATALAELFWLIYTCKRPVIGRINGAAIGGGTGFVAVCDIALAARSAVFSFSEVKIGVVPACIGPYVIKKMGEGKTRELFITGERMSAERARAVGLVNGVADDDKLDEETDRLVHAILTSGPEAVAMAKRLISEAPGMTPEQFKPYTAEMIARLRVSAEGQEGMDAFLNKRKPRWAE
ncbi:MAG TPA: enoyl-CoA hydratase-related protein [candidate division Zixibacteria bacterium]|nr:enoyl-CoA hydratase/isomerase family protein [candidate division Zixibacteria bacterium]MDD4918500.1 enoyl-CoA hydratase-related protein [candidate division Zixibacteria bacterium]MDM7973370.1 enoyl-CoA hydratase-related protein [candidate division Zixibacteria bacterium]HOD67562.1 enoyl-CoA hydratase-related protein [candidate division Zixibacteria bacterium]HOZ07013.1 enoyl-CoA hydratase-related protein [candidate division Zixibacteria bacterium]